MKKYDKRRMSTVASSNEYNQMQRRKTVIQDRMSNKFDRAREFIANRQSEIRRSGTSAN